MKCKRPLLRYWNDEGRRQNVFEISFDTGIFSRLPWKYSTIFCFETETSSVLVAAWNADDVHLGAFQLLVCFSPSSLSSSARARSVSSSAQIFYGSGSSGMDVVEISAFDKEGEVRLPAAGSPHQQKDLARCRRFTQQSSARLFFFASAALASSVSHHRRFLLRF